MSDELPPFQPSPLGLAPVTPETARRPGRKPKPAKEKKPRKAREPKLSLVTDADIAAAVAPKKPRKKRKVKIAEASPGMQSYLKLDKIIGQLVEVTGKDRAEVVKTVGRLLK